ncbi:MAG: DUF1634 domain-containing protein [Bacteroidetes bacterium]|nr:DUF1634 domain-containing protein [Bacteroidota bacterium]
MKRRKIAFFNITDDKIEQLIGTLLRIGVFISGAVVLFGAILFFSQNNQSSFSFSTFTGEANELRSIPAIIASAFQLHGTAVIQLGILLLIATPIARVVFSLFAFLLEEDFLYVGITIIVLCILLYSLSGG